MRDLGRTLVLFVTMFYLICYNLLVSVVVYPLFGEIAQALPGVSLKVSHPAKLSWLSLTLAVVKLVA